MAREFPDAEIVGIDREPVPIHPERIPKNCRFEVEDVNRELSRHHGCFDVVIVRFGGGRVGDHGSGRVVVSSQQISFSDFELPQNDERRRGLLETRRDRLLHRLRYGSLPEGFYGLASLGA